VDEVFESPIELPMMGLVNNYDGVEWRIKEMAQLAWSPAAAPESHTDIDESRWNPRGRIVSILRKCPMPARRHFAPSSAGWRPPSTPWIEIMIALPRAMMLRLRIFRHPMRRDCAGFELRPALADFPAGPHRAQDWFVENLRQVLEVVPAQKNRSSALRIMLTTAHRNEERERVGRRVQHSGSAVARRRIGNDVEFDSASLNPHYSYYDEHNHVHQVWMLGRLTAYNQLRASERLGVQGTALWRLGSADTSLWPVWDAAHADDAAGKN